jgi:hypothetical protein
MLKMHAEIGNNWFENRANIVDVLARNWAPGHKGLDLQNPGGVKSVGKPFTYPRKQDNSQQEPNDRHAITMNPFGH